jgi:hypothetical protein
MDTTRSLLVGFAALAASPALAQSLTVVNEPWPGEATHAEMLADAFGGTFASLGTVEGTNYHSTNTNTLTDIGFTNGSFTARRVADAGSVIVPNLGNLAQGDDSNFARGSYDAISMGGYSSLSHEFGFLNGDGEFTKLVASSDINNKDHHPSAEFEWAFRTSNGAVFSSDGEANNGRDHMVTYAIYDETDSLIAAVLFFEDWAGAGSDWDYNDFSVVLTLAPTPQAALLGLAGFGGLGLAAARRRR